MHIKHPFLDKKRGKYVVGPTGYYLSFTLSNTIKGTIIASVRSVSPSFVSFVVSHSTSKITDKELRRGGVIYKAVRWGEGSEKNIFAENIFDENIFAKNVFTKYFVQNIFAKKIFTKNLFVKNLSP